MPNGGPGLLANSLYPGYLSRCIPFVPLVSCLLENKWHSSLYKVHEGQLIRAYVPYAYLLNKTRQGKPYDSRLDQGGGRAVVNDTSPSVGSLVFEVPSDPLAIEDSRAKPSKFCVASLPRILSATDFSFFLLFFQAHSVPLLLRTMFTPKKNRNIRKKVNIDDGDETPAQDSGNNTPVPDNGNNIQLTLSRADAIHNLTFTLCFYSNAHPLHFFLLYRYR